MVGVCVERAVHPEGDDDVWLGTADALDEEGSRLRKIGEFQLGVLEDE
jgi:hypothetical protein